ncbi:ribonuclease H-like domain-containing protein [Tanacetum coccineum]
MVTRAQVGTVNPNPRFQGHVSHISPLPKSSSIALSDHNWRDAMYDEYNTLIKNSTWILVPKPPNVNMVRSLWLFQHKYHADGSLSRYKARLVANGCSQQFGVDYDDTFSPVVKPATIRTVLSLGLSRNWLVHQLDDKNAFLNGDLSEIVFDMNDLGALNYFLGISVLRDSTCMFLSQKKYALELLDKAHMANCNPTRTPVDTESKLGSDGDPISDPTLYRSLAGGLQYLTFTRPNISYAVEHVCLHMHDPREPHLTALKRILQYIRGTLDFGLQLYASITGDNLLSWLAKRQHTLSRSGAEAEYRGVANVVAETAWLRNLLRELHTSLLSVTLVYCDNVSAIYMTANPVQHQRTKHIEIDIHFVRDMVVRGQLLGGNYYMILYASLALKKLHPFQVHKHKKTVKRRIQKDLEILASLKHRHLISLKAYVHQPPDRFFLVYGYVPTGSLEDAMIRMRGDELQLGWDAWLRIAVGIINELQYIHFTCCTIFWNLYMSLMYADVFVFAEIALFAKGVHSGNYVTCVCWCLFHAMVSFKFSLMCGMEYGDCRFLLDQVCYQVVFLEVSSASSVFGRHVVFRKKAYGLLQLLVFRAYGLLQFFADCHDHGDVLDFLHQQLRRIGFTRVPIFGLIGSALALVFGAVTQFMTVMVIP